LPGKKPADNRNHQNLNIYTMAIAVRLTGIESHRIRRYEQGGLLSPVRTNGNQRLFSANDIEIIKQTAILEDKGINVEGIKAILAMRKGERD
jgi:MerR family transcriptional regulator, glutamine synthetase repressor